MLAILLLACQQASTGTCEPGVVSGLVVDQQGRPVAGAQVRTPGGTTTSDAGGAFTTVEGDGARWVRVGAAGMVERTRAGAPGSPLLVRLARDPGDAVRLVLGGDVMFGRRFLDPGEGEALVRQGHEAQDIASILSGVAPLLSAADVASVNLETALTTSAERNSEKEYLLISPPEAAASLAGAGVDVVSLANNHVYDALETGLEDTISALDEAGVAHFGAGPDVDGAWEPAIVERGGLALAFLGCTTVTGDQHEIAYVAGPGQGGAAACDEDRLVAGIARARQEADLVVVQLHGGDEYSEAPTEELRSLGVLAVEAGADLVAGHHPHVIQGLEIVEGVPVAWSLGNLVFDQTLWEPQFSGLLVAALSPSAGAVQAVLEPVVVDGYVPAGAAGSLGQRTARAAVGLSDGAVLDGGAAALDLAGSAYEIESSIELSGGGGWCPPVDLGGGWPAELPGTRVRAGREILRAGGFEEEGTGPACGRAILWEPGSERVAPDAGAARTGKLGLRMVLDPYGPEEVSARPAHRLVAEPGTPITVSGWFRGSGELELRVAWYDGTGGDQVGQSTGRFQATGVWSSFQLDLEMPAGASALLPRLVLPRPVREPSGIDVDDVRIVAWEADPGEEADEVQAREDAELAVRRRVLPGGG